MTRQRVIEQRRDEFLTVNEYALLMRQHPETVRRRIRDGRQPGALFTGGHWRIDLSQAPRTPPETLD